MQWKCHFPGIVKAVISCDTSSSFICQNLDVKSSIEKSLRLLCQCHLCAPLFPSWSIWWCWEFWLSSQTSCTIHRPCSCFLGTQRIGELYSELDLFTTVSLSHSFNVCSINDGALLGFWTVFCIWIPFFLRWILWVKCFASSRLYLLMLMAAWCLCRMSMYFSQNSSGTCRWHLCAIYSLDKVFFFHFRKFVMYFIENLCNNIIEGWDMVYESLWVWWCCCISLRCCTTHTSPW